MQVYTVLLDKSMYWKIGRNDLLTYDLKSLADWSFINPLVYSKLGFNTQGFSFPESRFTGYIGNLVLIETQKLMFVIPPQFDSDGTKLVEQFFEYLSVFLEYLRCSSKQADMPRDILAASQISIEELPQMTFPKRIKGMIKAYIAET